MWVIESFTGFQLPTKLHRMLTSLPSPTSPQCLASLRTGCGELSIDMFPEDGCLRVYGVGKDGTVFTEYGIECLKQIIADETAAGRAPFLWVAIAAIVGQRTWPSPSSAPHAQAKAPFHR
jgi:hypothetical protein